MIWDKNVSLEHLGSFLFQKLSILRAVKRKLNIFISLATNNKIKYEKTNR